MINSSIKKARLKMGLTLKELGTRVGLSESAIAKVKSVKIGFTLAVGDSSYNTIKSKIEFLEW